MGIGVLDMVEMYANNACDTQTLLPKEPVKSPFSCRRTKRRLSAASEDSGRPRSPKSPRSHRSETFPSSSSPSPSPERSSHRFSLTPPPYLTTDTEDEEIVKKSRLESSSSSSSFSSIHFSSHRSRETYDSRRKRFLRTAEALRHSGLLDITMKTAELLRKNQELQKEIESLQMETRSFVLSVLHNPENRPILDNIRSQAQLYEVVVPGSQGIMSFPSSATLTKHSFHRETIPGVVSSPVPSEDDISLASDDNVSSPSPAPTESDGTSSMSEDSDSSEKENLTLPRRESTSKR